MRVFVAGVLVGFGLGALLVVWLAFSEDEYDR